MCGDLRWRRWRGAILGMVAISLLVMSSCVDITTRIKLNRNHSGRLSLEYRFDADMLTVGVFDRDSSLLPLPVSKRDFEATADRIEGLSLVRYRRTSDDKQHRIVVVMRFDSLETLSRFYQPYQTAILFDEQQNKYCLLLFTPFDAHDGKNPVLDDASRQLAEELLQDYQVRFELTTPRAITAVSAGDYRGRQAVWNGTMSDLVTLQQPLWWRIGL